MAKGKDGKFKREDFAPELELERYWNVKHFEFALDSSDSSDPEITTINTGMEIDEDIGDMDPAAIAPISRKWVIKAAVVQPLTINAFASGSALRTCELAESFLVCLRKPSAGQGVNFDRQDPGVIGHLHMAWAEANAAAVEGGHFVQWPLALDILTPTPVWSETLEIMAATGIHAGEWDATKFCLSILYGWAPAYITDVLAGRQIIRG